MKFPAKYSQLPNYDYEYIKILHETNDGMNKNQFDDMVAEIKKASFKNKYKHRTHLENLGLIYTKANNVYLSVIGKAIKSNKISLSEGLKTLIIDNNELLRILKEMQLCGYFNNAIQKKELSEILHNKIYNETTIDTISRYIVPIINLFNIAQISNYESEIKNIYNNIKSSKENIEIFDYENILQYIEKVYIEIADEYGKVVAIEKINNILNTKYYFNKNNINDTWKYIYNNINLRFKYNLITLPSWGTKYKRIIINGQSFTHIIINL